MQKRVITLVLSAAVVVAVACQSDEEVTAPSSKILTFKAVMNGAGEVPANSTTGTGTFTATLDTATNLFTYDIVFSGLGSNVNNGHIHGPAAATATAGTTINFNTWPGAQFSFGLRAGTGHGVAILSASNPITATISGDSLKKLLFAGLTYANIHTTGNPGGEIRGQILKQ
ncbi:MAG: CHRD domain-containing protein [Gemmatimonadota bacterium]